MAKYLNDLDNFIRGTYRDENVYDVAEEDTQYLEDLLENCSLDTEDREIILKALGKPSEDADA
jgi:hypothetical protein